MKALEEAGFAYAVIDTPPAITDAIRAVVALAGLVLMPFSGPFHSQMIASKGDTPTPPYPTPTENPLTPTYRSDALAEPREDSRKLLAVYCPVWVYTQTAHTTSLVLLDLEILAEPELADLVVNQALGGFLDGLLDLAPGNGCDRL